MSHSNNRSDSNPSERPQAGIKTSALRKSYGKKEVVRGVNIDVNPTEIVGLLGPNGAGKTTSFYIIVGLVAATSGEVFLDGENITHLPMYKRARKGIGYLPQEASIFRKLTVKENLQAVAQMLSVPKPEQKSLVEEHLEELHLTHLAYQKAYTLSGGERRRLEISRALIMRPKFLLLDEPFSGVDPISVQEVKSIIVGLKNKAIGVLLTDHNVRETLSIVDRAYLIHEGTVLCQGSSEDLINNPESRRHYLGESFKL